MQIQTPATPSRARSPATLASWLHKVLETAAAQVPQLCSLAAQVYEHASWGAAWLESGLHSLHDSLAAIEGGLQAPAARHQLGGCAQQARVCSALVVDDAEAFRHRSTATDAQLRPLLLEFLRELRSLEIAVDRSLPWLAEMNDLVDPGTGEAESSALLADRLARFRSRLVLLQAVKRNAHRFHGAATQVLNARPALCASVQREVHHSCRLLQSQLEHVASQAASSRGGIAALAAARSDAQIRVEEALSQVLRLEQAQHSLAQEVAALRHRCSLLTPGARELDTVARASDLALH